MTVLYCLMPCCFPLACLSYPLLRHGFPLLAHTCIFNLIVLLGLHKVIFFIIFKYINVFTSQLKKDKSMWEIKRHLLVSCVPNNVKNDWGFYAIPKPLKCQFTSATTNIIFLKSRCQKMFKTKKNLIWCCYTSVLKVSIDCSGTIWACLRHFENLTDQ